MILTNLKLNKLLGKHISAFCGSDGYVDNGINHCAHFVSHVLKISYRTTCGTMNDKAKKILPLFVCKSCSHIARMSELGTPSQLI